MLARMLMFAALALIAPYAVAASTALAAKPQPKPLPPAPEGVVIQENVPYLTADREEKLDLYLPASRPMNAKSPAVVIIHGGGWRGGDKAADREFNIGSNLARAGYVCASVNYTLDLPNWPADLWDCKNAVRFLRANSWKYQVDTEHIGVIGGSAGGHLALMVGYTTDVPELEPPTPYPGISDKVQAVVDLYGLTNLFTRQTTTKDGSPTGRRVTGSAFVSGTATSNPEGWKLGSPVYHICKTTPPTLILHGKLDTTIDRDQATELAAKLTKLGVEHQMYLLDGVGHTFDLESWNHKPLPIDVRAVVIGFFDEHLKAKP